MEINDNWRQYSLPDNHNFSTSNSSPYIFPMILQKLLPEKRGRICLRDNLLDNEIILQLVFVTK